MHSATEAPSARIPSESGPPWAAKVHAGRPSRRRSASTRSIASAPCSPSHSRISGVASSTPLSRSTLGHLPLVSVMVTTLRSDGAAGLILKSEAALGRGEGGDGPRGAGGRASPARARG
ncbi:hypothetical protein CP982_01385 [Streptomyces spectabilis]|uniref:Uncharacterized protein n=1 Tax=Streptomyces spectabilis TaxID=68270 RepID=A0A5P2X3E8_STRST|nr:hypothetical protein CP982_01385 [Streptomyces spectabilis]